MREDGKIDYIELPADNLGSVKAFYQAAFGWGFTDYGPTYAGVEQAGLDGGFQADPEDRPAKPLVILYSTDLEAMVARVEAAGGTITVPMYTFPGGRRFHFQDPAGNELAVWSEN